MKTKICLWSGPRNISTALMYSFSSRDDTIVFDEPLYAHYLYYSKIKHPDYKKIINTYETNGNKVIKKIILKDYESPISFFKLMSHFTVNLNLNFLKEVKNIILIRNPLDVIASYNQIIKHPTIQDIGILDQYNMFRYFNDMNISYIIIDSKDILENPEKALKKLCEKLKITFDKKMLNWQKGPKIFDGIWAKYWYTNVHKTTGFINSKQKKIILKNQNKKLYHEAVKYYKLLKKP